MNLQTEDRADTRIIAVKESRIDAMIAIQFKEAVRQSAGDGPGRVLLDMSAVTFLDSSGLGAIVAVMKLFGPTRRLELAALHANVERVFRLTRMDTIFAMYPTVEAAFGAETRLANAR
jgi:anti-sigma B factor antagonist